MPTTEIFQMPLAAGVDIGDPNNDAAAIAKECFTTLSEQNGGLPIWFGHQKEDPSVLNALIGECCVLEADDRKHRDCKSPC